MLYYSTSAYRPLKRTWFGRKLIKFVDKHRGGGFIMGGNKWGAVFNGGQRRGFFWGRKKGGVGNLRGVVLVGEGVANWG